MQPKGKFAERQCQRPEERIHAIGQLFTAVIDPVAVKALYNAYDRRFINAAFDLPLVIAAHIVAVFPDLNDTVQYICTVRSFIKRYLSFFEELRIAGGQHDRITPVIKERPHTTRTAVWLWKT